MATILEPADLAPFADIDTAKADALVTHVLAQALAPGVAPCLRTTEDPDIVAAAKSYLVGVALRWHESGVASYQAYTAGAPTGEPRRERRNMLWPSEIESLQQLCVSGAASSSVYTVSLAPDPV